MPNSKEAEQSVLSAIFLSKNAQEIVFETIDENVYESDVVLDMLYVYDDSIENNDDKISKKVEKGREGFLFLKSLVS